MTEKYASPYLKQFKHKPGSAINEEVFNEHVDILKCLDPHVYDPQPDISGYQVTEHFGIGSCKNNLLEWFMILILLVFIYLYFCNK